MPEADPTEARKAGDAPLCFGSFEVLRDEAGAPLLLGAGNFGRTYKARHRFLDNLVALKTINERHAADATARHRFLIEGRAVKKLSHPHIARLDDFGEAGGVLYYAMEYCAGGDLAAYVQGRGAMPAAQAVEVGQQILGALKVAHAAGFVHRDIKPTNIMLLREEGPLVSKLIDFGLVHASAPADGSAVSEVCETEAGEFVGTPLFASPEQLLERELDGRSDLFSLGFTLWYLVLGAAPETGSSAMIAASRLSEKSYEPLLPDALPTPFRAFLSKMIAKDAGARFATAGEAFDALNACASALGLAVARDRGANRFADIVDDPGATIAEERVVPRAAALAEVVTVEATLETEFRLVSRGSEVLTGINYAGEPVGVPPGVALLHVLHPPLFEDRALLDLMRERVVKVKALGLREVMGAVSLRDFTDYMALVLGPAPGGDLLGELSARGAVRLADALGFLEKIATVCDRVVASGLPGVELAAGRIFVEGAGEFGSLEPRLHPRYLAVREAPSLVPLMEPLHGDASWEDDVRGQFAALIYRIVTGQDCADAACVSPRGYVPAAGLCEQANRVLAQAICLRSEAGTCGLVLRELLKAEGILLPSAPMASAGGAATRVPPPSVVAPPLPPPAFVAAPAKPRGFGKWIAMAAVVLALAVAAGVWMNRARNAAGGGESDPVVIATPPKPSALTLRFAAALPGHTVFTVGGNALRAERASEGGEWTLTIAAEEARLPLEVGFAAKGYIFTPEKMTIATNEAVLFAQPVSAERTRGTIHFVNDGRASDYPEAVVKMISPLRDELNLVEVDRTEYTTVFEKTPDASVMVPTGSYQISLNGGRANVAARRVNLDIVAGRTVDYEVPVSLAGQYAGGVTIPGEGSRAARQIKRLVNISGDLEGGMVIDLDGGLKTSYPMRGGRLDASGVYTATVQFSAPASGGAANTAYNQMLTIRQRDGGLEFSFRETPDVNTAVESHLSRVPNDKGKPVVALMHSATAEEIGEFNKAEDAPVEIKAGVRPKPKGGVR